MLSVCSQLVTHVAPYKLRGATSAESTVISARTARMFAKTAPLPEQNGPGMKSNCIICITYLLATNLQKITNENVKITIILLMLIEL
jgi:hypothetical protein